MKKFDNIKSKHVDHIENEKNILENFNHLFTVSHLISFKWKWYWSWTKMDSFKIPGPYILQQNSLGEVIFLLTTEGLVTST